MNEIKTKVEGTGLRKNNFDATTDPTVGDDSADGYEVNSLWTNNTSKVMFRATSVAVGAAVWAPILDWAVPEKITAMVDADKIPVYDGANKFMTYGNMFGPIEDAIAAINTALENF